jgi:hypothetical protein
MSNDLRVRQNFLSGVVDDNPLGSGATTLTSSALASLVAVGSTQHLAITLDPGATAGAPEIVYVTAHTASATTATILRGREGTTARAHNQNVPWSHGPTIVDFALAGTMLPAWIAPTFTNSWVNDGTAGYPTAGYYLGPDGTVHVRGVVKSGAASTAMFTLPAGYRPEFISQFLCEYYDGTNVGLVAQVIVNSNGQVSTNRAVTSGNLSLDGISFRQFG